MLPAQAHAVAGIVVTFFAALTLCAVEPEAPYRTAHEGDAALLATEDARSLPALVRLTTRYLEVSAEDEDSQALSFVVNSLSSSTTATKPVLLRRPLANGSKQQVAVLRLNALHYAPEPKDLQRFLKHWEELRHDPRYNLLVTADTVNFVAQEQLREDVWEKVTVPAFVHTDGKTYTARWVKSSKPKPVPAGTVARLLQPRVGIVYEELKRLLGTEAPLVDYRYFVQRATSSIKDDGLYRTLYGGLYYEFADVPQSSRKGQTDEDALFEQLGVGSKGETAAAVYERTRADQRIARFRSDVTGKPRRADFLRSLTSRDGEGRLSITHDIADKDVDIARHPLFNLLDFKDRARELLYERRNGLQGATLYNAAGKLQDEVPPDIAIDATIPTPHTRRLESIISCWRCHAANRGWKPAANDVKKLLGKYLEAQGDVSNPKRTLPDSFDRIKGLYAGDVEFKWMPRARDDYAAAVLAATGPWKESKDQTDVVELAIGRVSKIVASRKYEMVNAAKALRDMGWIVPEKQAPAFLATLCPQDEALRPGPEDPRIAALFLGLEITPVDWDLVRSFVVGRIRERP